MNEIKLVNSALSKHVSAITKLEDAAKKNVFEIACRLAAIKTDALFTDDGYKNVVEFAADVFGYARSTTLNYIKIAERYLDVKEETKGKKKVMVIQTICAHGNDDYTIGQLNALGKITQQEFINLDADGTISPEMSSDAIKKACKKYLEGNDDTGNDDTGNDDTGNDDTGNDDTGNVIDTTCNDTKEPQYMPFTVTINECMCKIFANLIDTKKVINRDMAKYMQEVFNKFLPDGFGSIIEWDSESNTIRAVEVNRGNELITQYPFTE